ncbi:MAG: MTH938/NDUFAF3 family protein [Pseudomonadota bacterium]
MKFTRETANALTIRRVERGRIGIGDAIYESSIVLTANEELSEIDAPTVERLTADHLDQALAANPEIVVLGTGWKYRMPPRDLTFALAKRGIGFEVMDTPAACRTYNILISEGRRPAALLLID